VLALMAARVLELAGATVVIFESADAATADAADRIDQTIRSSVSQRGRAVLGLATGATPEPIYARLVELHRRNELSFAAVRTYNLDEYYPISPCDPHSFHAYMHRHLFQHVDLPANQAHLLDGTIPEPAIPEHAAAFERWMADDGGLDLQLLGLGRNGHIGFNEPCELPASEALKLPTRLVDLHPTTRADSANDVGDVAKVIPRALTIGIAPILASRAILIVALGAKKADPVAQSLLGPMSARVPASLLQSVPGKVTWILDEASARELKTGEPQRHKGTESF
jgi:glucosamine-6-phosphate deaminase